MQVFTTPEDNALSGTVTMVDLDGDPLTASVVTGPAHGSLVFNSTNGSFTYTPNADYNGSDSFTYKVNDGTADSPVYTINISVTPVNDAPVGADSTVTTLEDTSVNGSVVMTDVDGNPLTASVVTGPAHGSLVFDSNNGSFTYTPSADYNGADSFTYKVNDGTADSPVYTINISVTPVNDAPVGADSTVTTLEDTSVNGSVVMTDVDGNPLTASVVTGPAHGSLVFDSNNGSFTYTPSADYNGADSFTYKVNDGTVDSSVYTIYLNVTPLTMRLWEQMEL